MYAACPISPQIVYLVSGGTDDVRAVAAGASADDALPRVFLNHDSRPTAQILADTFAASSSVRVN